MAERPRGFFVFMENMDDDFLGFLLFESSNCPKYGQLVTRDEVEENLTEDKATFICPYCKEESEIKKLG